MFVSYNERELSDYGLVYQTRKFGVRKGNVLH
jgi:hypothetical protein